MGMATNKKKIFITESMSQQGRALLRERDDIEIVEFPNMISAGDFEVMLKEQAPVHGVALGATRFGEPELEASKDMKVVTRIGVGYDAVDVPALSRRKIPLMVAGTANSPSVAEQAIFMMLSWPSARWKCTPSSRTATGATVWASCPTICLARLS
jgi:D-3-phosphoglycerate dehydrogenase